MTLGSAAAVPAPARAGASRAARPSRWHAGTLAAAGTIPVTAVNAARRPSCRSEGHHPANDRPAIPTRAYESGSGHGHDAAPACHPHPPRPPPHPAVTWWVPGAEPAGPPLRRQGRSLRSRRCRDRAAPGPGPRRPLRPLPGSNHGAGHSLPGHRRQAPTGSPPATPPQPATATPRHAARPAAAALKPAPQQTKTARHSTSQAQEARKLDRAASYEPLSLLTQRD